MFFSITKNSYEKMLFLILAVILIWRGWDMRQYSNLVFETGIPVIAESNEAYNLKPDISIREVASYLKADRDFLVPVQLLATTYTIRKSRADNVVSTPKEDKVDKVFLPPKPHRDQTGKVEAAQKSSEPYRLPVDVKGFINASGAPRKVLVTKADTSEYFTLTEGEQYNGITVVEITSESVTFENELGRRFKIHRNSLVKDKDEDVVSKTLQDTGKMVSDAVDKVTESIPDIPAAKKKGKGIDLNKAMDVYDLMKKGDIDKALKGLSKEEKETLMDMAKDFMKGK